MIKIYKITNTLNDKQYIGQMRRSIETSFLQHSKTNSPLCQAMRQCGLENFTIESLEKCDTQETGAHGGKNLNVGSNKSSR